MRRSMLFIPGNSPAMLLNADVHGADAIILDLEDAVSPSEKDAARVLVRNAVRALGGEVEKERCFDGDPYYESMKQLG